MLSDNFVLEQNKDSEQYTATFPKNFKPDNLKDKNICYFVDLKFGAPSINKIIASLDLITGYKLNSCN